MENGAAISIAEIQSHYKIKQSAAYKWRTALKKLKLEESWENYDRINNREINLSGAVKGSSIAVVEPSKIQAHNHAQEQPTVTAAPAPAAMMDSGFGLSIGRLQELNSEAELEVRRW
jgi:hypothetical protein